MASVNKFEQLLEYVVNGEQDKADELFHALVVAKSREIYENIISESEDDDSDDSDDDTDESVEEAFGKDNDNDDSDDFMGDVEADNDDSDDMGDDDSDDNMGDDDMDDAMGGDDNSSDLADIKDQLADLKAEFEKLLHGEEAEEHDHPGIHDMGGHDMGSHDMGGDMGMDQPEDEGYGMFEEDIEEINMSPAELMREYVDKIGEPYKSGNGISNTKEGGHVGAQAGSVTGSTHTRSPVAGKNDMGGTTSNIARGGEAGKGGTQGGLANPTTKEENFGNINVPGGKAGKTGFTHKVSDGHGTEKKGKGEAAGTNTKSLFR